MIVNKIYLNNFTLVCYYNLWRLTVLSKMIAFNSFLLLFPLSKIS